MEDETRLEQLWDLIDFCLDEICEIQGQELGTYAVIEFEPDSGLTAALSELPTEIH